ncbi:MAG: DNA repair protein RecO [Pseudomonadota bacterium]
MSIEWRDKGIVLSARRYGETGHIVSLMTAEHGRHAGLVPGRRKSSGFEPGTIVAAKWRARLIDQLGTLDLETQGGHIGTLIDRPLPLAALASACALVDQCVPERSPMPPLHDGLRALIDVLCGDHWAAAYVKWEIGLLSALGFGLSLDECAAGGNDQLAYVSPRTGRAVSLSAGEPYREKLLTLPGFLIGAGDDTPEAVLDGLALTEFFLERYLLGQAHRTMPAARLRYVESYRTVSRRSSGDSSDV